MKTEKINKEMFPEWAQSSSLHCPKATCSPHFFYSRNSQELSQNNNRLYLIAKNLWLIKPIIMIFKEEKLLCVREQMEFYNNIQANKIQISLSGSHDDDL